MTSSVMAPGCVVLAVAGEIDLGSRERFVTALRAQPSASARVVVVDLSRVSFCEAHGVGELAGLRERASLHGVAVHLVVATTGVRRCLDALGVTTYVPVHHDLPAALAAAGFHTSVRPPAAPPGP